MRGMDCEKEKEAFLERNKGVIAELRERVKNHKSEIVSTERKGNLTTWVLSPIPISDLIAKLMP